MKTIIYQSRVKERLDKFLTAELAGLSRNQIQKLIKNGLVLVNNYKVEPHFFLKQNDHIAINYNKNKINTPVFSSSYPPIKIIAETDDYLVINKPAGLVVHPATEKEVRPTLTSWLLKKYPKIKTVGDLPTLPRRTSGSSVEPRAGGRQENLLRPGLVHRLDKNVSGLMVVAKNQKMFKHLKEQFKSRQTVKEYLGLVYGKINKEEGVIDFPLERQKKSGKIAARPKGKQGKEAITEFTVLKKFKHFTYLKINLKTGRTHQIRVHLRAYGYPLVGDRLYQNKKIKVAGLERIFLHACLLGFNDLKNNWQEYHSPLPEALHNFLNNLK